ncbi:AAA family ATPase [Microbacterium sp. NEAU-LLC]|uniref:AAA family ATPase n=1 Tax=Microbacterium helvum TaxID=2773713 RepID=A0ABR8NM77_9MICO|nr:LuxR family transcriptional regulator [Microbacterium helvum]MBD3941772.1 AAA family ATPase [Microbacterium helvum]
MTPATVAPMVGREAELQVLLEAYAAGRAGSPRAVVIRGEAGIGKTRLLEEFRAAALRSSRPGPQVVAACGQCVDLGPIGAPFTPIRRVLHEIYTAVGDERFRAAAGSPAVVATLASLIPELADASLVPSSGGDYVAEAIERIIENLSAEVHLLIVIEDLHWADAATLALLKTLAVTLRGRHVTLICTYRSDDVGRGHPLRAVLAELDRSRVVTGVEITRLRPEDVAEHIRSLTGGAVSTDHLEAVTARSEGVPFFVEELVDLKDGELPDTLRDVVLARFERLTPHAQEVVGLVAVGGVHVDDDLLNEVHDGDPRDLREGLREAVAGSVLVSDEHGYTFRHALIQEAVHDDLLPNDRVEAHRAYAEALQRRVDDGDATLAAEAAVHWLAARDLIRAFDATAVAREWSNAANAPAASVKLGEQLLELWGQVPDADERVGLSRAALSRGIAEDYFGIGENERSLRSAEAGARFARPEERLLRAELLRLVGARQRTAGRDDAAAETFRAARTLLDDSGDAGERALLAKIDAILAVAEPAAESEALLDRAVTLAEGSGDDDALAQTLYLRAWFVSDHGRLEAAVEDLRRAVDVSADISTHHTAVNNLVDLLGRLGRYDEALELGRAAFDETVLAGRERGLGAHINANVAEIDMHLGHASAGVARAQRCLSLFPANPFFQSFTLRLLALAALYDDDPATAAGYRERAESLLSRIDADPDEQIGWALVAGVAAAREVCDGAAATGLIALAPRTAELLEGDYPGLSQRMLPVAAWLCRLSPEAGDTLLPAIERLSRRSVDGSAPAILAVTRAYLDDDVASWTAALAHAEAGSIPNRYVHTSRLGLAQSLIVDGQREAASDLLSLIVDEAPGQGAALIARWARELAARAGIAWEGMDAGGRGTASGSGVTALTPRELQVLALVAEGLTNPQIGERLFISPKTASVHVSAILGKIGAANRAEAAAQYAAGVPESA